jgi:hypothetical protein
MFDPLAAMLLWCLCGLRDGLTLSWMGMDVGVDVERADMIRAAVLTLEHKGAPRKQARESV